MNPLYQQARLVIPQVQQAKGWQDKYRLIMQLGKLETDFPEHCRDDRFKIDGCETDAWLVASIEHSHWHFRFDADARIIKGIVAMLLSEIDGKCTADLTAFNLEALFMSFGLTQGLSPSRNNGVYAVIEKIRQLTAG